MILNVIIIEITIYGDDYNMKNVKSNNGIIGLAIGDALGVP